ncbi:MAG: hypothetical protein IT383_14205 [Deltaproteobacteria bacterium]|nr:hypothetical protein [Deltaproteobacteria bacterium]
MLAAGCATGSAPERAALAPPPTSARVLDVDVTLLPNHLDAFGGVSLRYCPVDGVMPRRLRPENRRALPFLVAATDEEGRALPIDDDGVRTRELAGCALLTVDVARLADTLDDKDLAQRVGDDVIATPDLWLWRPEPFAADARVRVRLERAGFDVAVPWVDVEGGRFVVGPQAFALKSDAAFGRFATEELDAGGARLALARLDDGRAPAALSRWLAQSAHAVATVHGAFPEPRLNVLVVPTHVARPIVVGFYSRGGGPTALFYVGDAAADLDDDDLEATGRWALTHELAHALLPPVKSEDAWLNEGIATWYQDLLARRTGMLPDDVAYWTELVRGLRTGRDRSDDDRLTVADASRRMHATGAYQHTYWAGVALALLAEVEAQRQGASVDDLVRALRRRFPVDDQARDARTLLHAIAEGRGAVAARALERAFDRNKDRPWPDVDLVLAELGVVVDGAGTVTLDERAPLAGIRRAITRPTVAGLAPLAARASEP